MLNIRGRSVSLRGLRRPPAGLLRWLLILGPGLITASAGNEAGGIATYSSAGAKFGYDLIWVMVVITVSLAVVQEMCARLGAATRRGLLDLVRERYGIGWALFVMATLFIANAGVIITEFMGIGAAAGLFGLPRLVVVPLAAALLWYLVIYGSYAWVEKIFLGMTLVFFAYPVAAVLADPDWGEVLQGAWFPLNPKIPFRCFGVFFCELAFFNSRSFLQTDDPALHALRPRRFFSRTRIIARSMAWARRSILAGLAKARF